MNLPKLFAPHPVVCPSSPPSPPDTIYRNNGGTRSRRQACETKEPKENQNLPDYKCHHAQQRKKKQCQSFWTRLTSPCHTCPSFPPSPSDTIYRNKGGTRSRRQACETKGPKENQNLPERRKKIKIRRYRELKLPRPPPTSPPTAHVDRSPEEQHVRHHYMRTGDQIPSPISRSLAN